MKLGDDFLGKLILLVAGFAMTGGVGSYLSFHWSQRAKEQEIRNEQKETRAKIGVDIEADVLNETGTLYGVLNEARNLAVNKDPIEADKYYREQFLPAKRKWDSQIFQIRNQVGRSFGRVVAQQIYDPGNAKYALDICGVFASRDDPQFDNDCSARFAKEHDGLDRVIARLNDMEDFDREGLDTIWPRDFTSNLRFAVAVLYRVIDCKRGEASDNSIQWGARNAIRCGNLGTLQHTLNSRVNLTGKSREELADEFLHVWTGQEGGADINEGDL